MSSFEMAEEYGAYLVKSGLVLRCANVPPYYDYPKYYNLNAVIADPCVGKNNFSQDMDNLGRAGGVSLDSERAWKKLIGEAVERYCLVSCEDDSYTISTYNELKEKKEDCEILDPNDIVAGCNKKGSDRRRMSFAWCDAINFYTGNKILIPAQLVDVPYFYDSREEFLRVPITTGAASGKTDIEAILAGLYEVIERDSFMLSWLSFVRLERLLVDDIDFLNRGYYGLLLHNSLREVLKYQIDVKFYRLYSKIRAVYSLMCLLKDPYIDGMFSIGAASSHSLILSMLKSLEESMQILYWLRSINSRVRKIELGKINDMESRGKYILSNQGKEAINDWVGSAKDVNLYSIIEKDFSSEDCNYELIFYNLLNSMREEGCLVVGINLSHRIPNVIKKKIDIRVWKMIVPQYQPLYLIEDLKDIAWQRLQGIPKDMLVDRPNVDISMNSAPHPFL